MVGIIILVGLFSGCQFAMWNSEYDKNKSVTVWQGSVLTKNTLKDAYVEYNGVIVKLSDWSSVGDVESIEAVSKGIIYALATYSSFGSYPTTLAIIEAFKNGDVEKISKKYDSGEIITKEDFTVIPVSKGNIKK